MPTQTIIAWNIFLAVFKHDNASQLFYLPLMNAFKLTGFYSECGYRIVGTN